MSTSTTTGKGTFSASQIRVKELRNQYLPNGVASSDSKQIPDELPPARSYFSFPTPKHLGLILGISASAIGVYFGARYLLDKFSSPALENSDEFGLSRQADGIEGLQGNRSEWLRKNTKVTLHQCPRGYNTPCISPFSLKLETFLRVANIPYEINYTPQPHAKNSPWLTVGDHDITDAHECIQFLCNTFEINLEGGAKASRLTASRLVGIQLDNHIYWGIALWRWVYDKGASLKDIQPLSPKALDIISSVSESVRRAAWYHGIGRLPYEKVLEIIKTDLADLSAALGSHQNFMGDRPGEVDCNAFAMLAQILWNMPSSPFEQELLKYDNLVQFVYRMRDTYWPDWKEILHKPGELKVPEKFHYHASQFHMSMTGLQDIEISEEAPASTIDAETKKSDNSESTGTPAAGAQLNSANRARSTPVKLNVAKVSQNKPSTKVSSDSEPIPPPPPKVPSRVITSAKVSRPPPDVAPPQPGPKNTNVKIAAVNPTPIQAGPIKMATISQAQLKSLQNVLNDLTQQLGMDTTQSQQNFWNNNYSGIPNPAYGSPAPGAYGYDPRTPIPPPGGRPMPPNTAAFYPPGQGQEPQPGAFNPQQPQAYYPPPTSYYPYPPPPGYYPNPNQPM